LKLRSQLNDARERLDAQRSSLAAQLERASELDRLRWEGEMIYAFLHTLTAGQIALEVEGRTIALDPRQSGVENAQERFRAYDKAKGALAGVPERLREVETRLAGIDQTLALLELADGFEQIEGIAREMLEQGLVRPNSRRPAPKTRRQPPLRVVSPEGYTIYVGRSAG
ncbi:fibronectin-binding protein, partial [Kouleothrix aurantiaca]